MSLSATCASEQAGQKSSMMIVFAAIDTDWATLLHTGERHGFMHFNCCFGIPACKVWMALHEGPGFLQIVSHDDRVAGYLLIAVSERAVYAYALSIYERSAHVCHLIAHALGPLHPGLHPFGFFFWT